MTCEELQGGLPDIMEGERTPEQEFHLESCRTCLSLLSDLDLISREARLLQASEEPSSRVWNNLEIALRKEGMIHPPRRPSAWDFARGRNAAWLLPIAATFLVALTVARYQLRPYGQTPAAGRVSAPVVTASLDSRANPPGADDDQVLEAVGSHSPALRAAYAADLQNVNAYIRDAEESAHSHPNDVEAQQYLMDAYEQKNMMYEMALDRSLP